MIKNHWNLQKKCLNYLLLLGSRLYCYKGVNPEEEDLNTKFYLFLLKRNNH